MTGEAKYCGQSYGQGLLCWKPFGHRGAHDECRTEDVKPELCMHEMELIGVYQDCQLPKGHDGWHESQPSHGVTIREFPTTGWHRRLFHVLEPGQLTVIETKWTTYQEKAER